ncbi:MAG: tRNA (adenosine(37)-N6)-threonylcarbamoyltransferase complex dimerization subunit type 1 TsaB [Rhodospirillaceae bacterium]|nr:tRNA (adenosine(37)-N6)-threonylcarbamoyltransferase complex dimerization subunit type 1 TsaB [Rhodospirillaceae bacterium]
MARILIFDTSGAACSAAVWAGDGVIAERYEAMPRGQAERLLPMVEETLAAAGIAFGQLDAVGVTRGPGAFTGLRIGLAAARGMALALEIPAIGITTFEALAVRAPAGCAVAIDTRRNDFFCQCFGPGGAAGGEPEILGAADAISLAAARSLPLITDSPALAGGETGPGGGRTPDAPAAGPPRAAAFASLVAGRHHALGEGRPGGFDMPRPLYLRPPEARLPETRRPGQAR